MKMYTVLCGAKEFDNENSANAHERVCEKCKGVLDAREKADNLIKQAEQEKVEKEAKEKADANALATSKKNAEKACKGEMVGEEGPALEKDEEKVLILKSDMQSLTKALFTLSQLSAKGLFKYVSAAGLEQEDMTHMDRTFRDLYNKYK